MGMQTESIKKKSVLSRFRGAPAFLVVAAVLLVPAVGFREAATQARREQELEIGGFIAHGAEPLEIAAQMLGGLKGMLVNVLWLMAIDAEDKGRLNEVNTYYDMVSRIQPRFTRTWESWMMTMRSLANTSPNTSLRWFWLKSTITAARRGEKFTGRSADLFHQESFIYRVDFGRKRPGSAQLCPLLFQDTELTGLYLEKPMPPQFDAWLTKNTAAEILADPDALARASSDPFARRLLEKHSALDAAPEARRKLFLKLLDDDFDKYRKPIFAWLMPDRPGIDSCPIWLSLDRIDRILGPVDAPPNDPRKKSDRLTFYYSVRARTRQQLIAATYYRPTFRARLLVGEKKSVAPEKDNRPPGWLDYVLIRHYPPDTFGFFDCQDGEKEQIAACLKEPDAFLHDEKNIYKSPEASRYTKKWYSLHFMTIERKWAIQDSAYAVTLGLAAECQPSRRSGKTGKVTAADLERASIFYARRANARVRLLLDLYSGLLNFLSRSEKRNLPYDPAKAISALLEDYHKLRKREVVRMSEFGGYERPEIVEDLDWRYVEPVDDQ